MSWTHLRDTEPVARKRFHCFVCSEPIEIGEKCLARTGIGDWGPCTFRMHLECVEQTLDWHETDWECHDADPGLRPKKTEEITG